jgi:hypothetical protein
MKCRIGTIAFVSLGAIVAIGLFLAMAVLVNPFAADPPGVEVERDILPRENTRPASGPIRVTSPDVLPEYAPGERTTTSSGESASGAGPAVVGWGDPEPVRPPRVMAWGKDDRYETYTSCPPDSERRLGQIGGGETMFATRTRLVSGRVYELRADVRIPLSGVMIYDQPRAHRTLSDSNGYFSFEAYWSAYEQRDQRDGELRPSQSYVIKLFARAIGYEMVSGRLGATFFAEQVESAGGVELYLQPTKNELIDVWVKNPELASSDVKVSLAAVPELFENDRIYDERLFVSTTADAEGRARFSVPAASFALFGVSAAGVRVADARKSTKDNATTWEVVLESCSTSFYSGKVLDMRTGKPVGGCMIHSGAAFECAFSSDGGSFEFWLADELGARTETNVRRVECEALGYLTSTVEITTAEGAQVHLRPLVRVSGTLLIRGYSPNKSDRIWAYESIAPSWFGPNSTVIEDGSFEFEFFPWGVLSLAADLYGTGERRTIKLIVPEECWHGEPPFSIQANPE